MRTSLARLGVLVSTVVILSAAQRPVSGQNWVLSRSKTGDWSVASNWGGTVPSGTASAYVANGGTATITKPGETCGQLTIGAASVGGAVVLTSGKLTAGVFDIENGACSISGNATLSTSYEYVPPSNINWGGAGSFTQTGGTHTVLNSLYLGYGGIGTYTISGSALLSAATLVVGEFGTPGTIFQSGNARITAGGMYMLAGTYTLGDSALLSAGTVMVGGSFTQTGGTNASTMVVLGVSEPPIVGQSLYGTYSLSGNALLSTSNLFVGATAGGMPSIGVFTQSGGTTVAGNLYIGYWPFEASFNESLYTLGGSALLSASNAYLAGTLTQSAGTVKIAGTLEFLPFTDPAYNFNGGVLVLSNSQAFAGRFYFNGGTLQAGASFSQTGLTLNAAGGNETIDPAGYTVTLSGVTGAGNLIEAGAGKLILSGTNSYSGGTTVSGGELIVADSQALLSGSNLIVGDAAAFSTLAVADAPPGGSPASPVPEPCTLALVASAAILFGVCGLRRRFLPGFRGKSKENEIAGGTPQENCNVAVNRFFTQA